MLWLLFLLASDARAGLYDVSDIVDEVINRVRNEMLSDKGNIISLENNLDCKKGRVIFDGFAMDEARLGDLSTLKRSGYMMLTTFENGFTIKGDLIIENMFLEGYNASGPGFVLDRPRIVVGYNKLHFEASAAMSKGNHYPIDSCPAKTCAGSIHAFFEDISSIDLQKKNLELDYWMKKETTESHFEFLNEYVRRVLKKYLDICKLVETYHFFL